MNHNFKLIFKGTLSCILLFMLANLQSQDFYIGGGNLLNKDNTSALEVNFSPKARSGVPFPAHSLTAMYGMGGMTGTLLEAMNAFEVDYFDALRTGICIGVDYSYFQTVNSGIGVLYESFNALHKYGWYYVQPGIVLEAGLKSDQIQITFVGPSYTYRKFDLLQKNAIQGTIGLGYLGYRHTSEYSNRDILIKGATLGLILSGSYDFYIADHTYFRLKLSGNLGGMKNLDSSTGSYHYIYTNKSESRLNLSRINFSVGLGFKG